MRQDILRKKVLVVAAHPDDEVLGCGATIAKHTHQGDQVVLVLVADGVSSRTYDPMEPLSREKELSVHAQAIQRRNQEAHRAAGILGVQQDDVHLLNLADQRLDAYPLLDIIKHIEKIKDGLQPSVVYTHFWGDLNLDHQIVCRAVLTAFRPGLSGHTIDLLHFEVPESTYLSLPLGAKAFVPNHYVEVRETFHLKLKALEAYESEARIYPHCRSVQFIEELGAKRGQESHVPLAEAFVRLPANP